MAGVNHTGNNHHGTGSRTNSLEPPTDPDLKGDHHRDSRTEEDGALGILAAAEHRRQHSIRFDILILIFYFNRVCLSSLHDMNYN